MKSGHARCCYLGASGICIRVKRTITSAGLFGEGRAGVGSRELHGPNGGSATTSRGAARYRNPLARTRSGLARTETRSHGRKRAHTDSGCARTDRSAAHTDRKPARTDRSAAHTDSEAARTDRMCGPPCPGDRQPCRCGGRHVRAASPRVRAEGLPSVWTVPVSVRRCSRLGRAVRPPSEHGFIAWQAAVAARSTCRARLAAVEAAVIIVAA